MKQVFDTLKEAEAYQQGAEDFAKANDKNVIVSRSQTSEGRFEVAAHVPIYHTVDFRIELEVASPPDNFNLVETLCKAIHERDVDALSTLNEYITDVEAVKVKV